MFLYLNGNVEFKNFLEFFVLGNVIRNNGRLMVVVPSTGD
jgi:hypothetical protein